MIMQIYLCLQIFRSNCLCGPMRNAIVIVFVEDNMSIHALPINPVA